MKANDSAFPNTDGETFCNDGLTVRNHIAIEMAKAFVIGVRSCGERVSNREIPAAAFALADAIIEKSEK